ncbi:unnamed protein product [Adineta steineri]|uniref:Uncharacterized protein n=1 Tax=Adineta steineri TaxID=433720 RepID=A0A813ND15_9BILA|nr:unnamed protein product [Adineta steineri]CAF0739099.1 unnamed protein product [Adineta steineri]CAF0770485.1 unnamed protein product [Adineta steineri]
MKTARSRDSTSLNISIDEPICPVSFRPHITERLTGLDHPKTSLDHEILHTLRESFDDRSTPISGPVSSSSLDYALWLEAGKHSHKSTYAKSLDGKPPINYNIWRNYHHYYSNVKNKVSRRSSAQTKYNDHAAYKYPILIPAPSQLGENHLRKYFEANKRELFQNQSHFRMALIKADNDERLLRLLSLKSQQRNPPMPSDIDEPSQSSDISPVRKSTAVSISRNRQSSIQISPQPVPRYQYDSRKKLVLAENHPLMEKVKFEQELKTAINFHRELKRTKEGSEKSLYADHRPV